MFQLFPVRSKIMCFWSCTMLYSRLDQRWIPNLEISQSGSYVPHGILNWVISRMAWVKLWEWNLEQLISSKLSWASPFLSSPSSRFSCSTAILFCIRKWTKLLLLFHKQKEQIQQTKLELITKRTYAERRNVQSSLSLYCVKGKEEEDED